MLSTSSTKAVPPLLAQESALSPPNSDEGRFPRIGFTSFPNVLLDHIMPTLSGSEWQLLCVIIRQTQGWQDPITGGRKTSDWLSHKQLKARTGRGSDAVCHAIESLVRQGHIEVKNEQGVLLATPSERRRSGSRLFYEIGPALREHFASSSGYEETPRLDLIPETRIGKPETTKENPTKNHSKAFGKSPTPLVQSGAARPKAVNHNHGCECLHSQTDPQTVVPPSHELPPPTTDSVGAGRIIAAYQKLTENQKAPNANFSPLLNSIHASRLENALYRYGMERLLVLLEAFFESDFSLMKRNASLASFIDSVHILAARRPQNRQSAPTLSIVASD